MSCLVILLVYLQRNSFAFDFMASSIASQTRLFLYLNGSLQLVKLFLMKLLVFTKKICYPETRELLCFNQGELCEREVISVIREDVEQLRLEIIELLPNSDLS